MSKGMWTKQLTVEGKTFYFNAAQQRSEWQPPSDAIIHEAPQLQPPAQYAETSKTDDVLEAGSDPAKAIVVPVAIDPASTEPEKLPPSDELNSVHQL
jgi:hypothetical protein